MRASLLGAVLGLFGCGMPEKVVIGNAELWHGDCREVLPLLRRCAIVSDPPYGIAFHKGGGGTPGAYRGRRERNRNSAPIIGDDKPFDPSHLLDFDDVVLFGADHFAERLPHGRWLAWDKLDGKDGWDSFSDVEFAWHNKRGASRIFRLTWKGMCQGACKDKNQPRTHPTQKPVDLMEWCIEQAGRPPVVCDPYMGTGATGVAAMNLGLRFIGVEIDRGYFDIACERVETAQRQGAMLLPAPAAPPEQAGLCFEP